jgi:hypothetical protein
MLVRPQHEGLNNFRDDYKWLFSLKALTAPSFRMATSIAASASSSTLKMVVSYNKKIKHPLSGQRAHMLVLRPRKLRGEFFDSRGRIILEPIARSSASLNLPPAPSYFIAQPSSPIQTRLHCRHILFFSFLP